MVDNVLFGWVSGGDWFSFGLVLLVQSLVLQLSVRGTPPSAFLLPVASPQGPGVRFCVVEAGPCGWPLAVFLWPGRAEPGTRRPAEAPWISRGSIFCVGLFLS